MTAPLRSIARRIVAPIHAATDEGPADGRSEPGSRALAAAVAVAIACLAGVPLAQAADARTARGDAKSAARTSDKATAGKPSAPAAAAGRTARGDGARSPAGARTASRAAGKNGPKAAAAARDRSVSRAASASPSSSSRSVPAASPRGARLAKGAGKAAVGAAAVGAAAGAAAAVAGTNGGAAPATTPVAVPAPASAPVAAPVIPAAPSAAGDAVRLPMRAARAQLPPHPGDDVVVTARNAYAAGDVARFEAAAGRVDNHPLRPHVDAWRLRLRLADTLRAAEVDAAVRAFLDRHAGTAAADGLRRDWLLSLARRGQWAEFEAQYPQWTNRADDPQPGCADARRRALGGDPIALAVARDALPLNRELGDACLALFEQLAGQGALSQGELWRRVRAAVDANSLGTVRKLAAWLPALNDPGALGAALDKPQAEVLVAPTDRSRELVVIALARLARIDAIQAAERLMRVGPRLPDDDRAWLWAQVAAAGARKLLPDAADWARRGAIVPGAGVTIGSVSDDTLAALVRAGLRVRDWKLVRGSIERMTEAGRADPAWRYWNARAMAAEGQSDDAAALLRGIAGPWGFYPVLAAEELGLAPMLPARPSPSSEDEQVEALAVPGVVRALKFADLGMRPESVREMAFVVRTMTDRQIAALSEALRRRGLYDRAIAIAERTTTIHDAGLRFPMPYRDMVVASARGNGLDPAFVYGLVRQESRFLPEARSGVGAAGLMQLMPATAQWVARKVGDRSFTPARIGDPDLNLRFGSYYLRRVLDELDGSPMLAAAAYNAGPGRPKAWRASLPAAIDGAAFAETIPFTETRDYVKKVLANSVAYAALLEGNGAETRLPSLKARLGMVAPRAAVPGEAP